jgi:raffinose/stachyose/melibiose transport system permease protein
MASAAVVPEGRGASRHASRSASASAYVRGRRRLYWPFLLPALILYVTFLIVPTIATVVLSFSRWIGAGDTPKFNGLTEYRAMFRDPGFRYGLINTLLYVVIAGIGTFAVAFLLTTVLREMKSSKLIRAILFFPNIVSPLAIGMFLGFIFVFNPQNPGLANFTLKQLGLPQVKFLAPKNVPYVVMAALIWASLGFYLTILMAAVDRIPPYLYEDAELAGATAFQKFRNITLPLTWDVLGVAGVLWTISAVKIFELVFVLAGPGTYSPPVHAWTLGIYVFDRSFGGQGTPQYGSACACAVVMIALVTVLVLALRRLMRREELQF